MIRKAVLIFSLFLSSAAIAQTAPVAAPERPQLTEEQRTKLRADRDACRAEVKPDSLPRAERRGAMRRCVEAKNPDLKPMFARGEARRAEMRQVRDTCREEIKAQKLRGPERRTAIQSCIVQKKPEMAKVFSCVDQAKAKNMQPGMERRDFMRSCLRA